MKTSVVKLVDAIIRKIQETPESGLSETGIRSWLQGQGYKKHDIEAALRLVKPRFLMQRPAERAVTSVRTLSVYEEYKLTPEARNALMRLEMYGMIDVYEREMILDRLGQVEGEVDIEGLDYLLSWVVYGGRDVESQQTIYNMLDGENTVRH